MHVLGVFFLEAELAFHFLHLRQITFNLLLLVKIGLGKLLLQLPHRPLNLLLVHPTLLLHFKLQSLKLRVLFLNSFLKETDLRLTILRKLPLLVFQTALHSSTNLLKLPLRLPLQPPGPPQICLSLLRCFLQLRHSSSEVTGDELTLVHYELQLGELLLVVTDHCLALLQVCP